jgi:hypothetical protein
LVVAHDFAQEDSQLAGGLCCYDGFEYLVTHSRLLTPVISGKAGHNMTGRTVRIFLADGTSRGVMIAEIINWTGQVTVAARTQLAKLADREAVRRTGVYVLSGESPDDLNRDIVYIGESDNVWKRLARHERDADRDFWQRTAIITSKDENLTKAHVRYLESRLIQIASQAQRAKLTNGTAPETPPLPESDIADMEYFLAQVQILLPVLGFSFVTPRPTPSQKEAVREEAQEPVPIFEMRSVGTVAFAQEIDDEFVVLEDSTVRKETTSSIGDPYQQIRERLVANGKLIDMRKDYWKFTEDVPFNSPSAAATIIAGATRNGRTEWKVKGTNQTYAQWYEAQIAKAEAAAASEQN